MDWTKDRIELLKKMWGEGLSASQIAAELGGVSRNSVIGKVHRLGLAGREKKGPMASIPRQRKPRSADRMIRIARPAVRRPNAAIAALPAFDPDPEAIESIVPIGQRCSILEVTEGKCRWPVGDPAAPDFFFCGGKTCEPFVYCGYHARLAYVPPKDRSSRRPLRPHYRD